MVAVATAAAPSQAADCEGISVDAADPTHAARASVAKGGHLSGGGNIRSGRMDPRASGSPAQCLNATAVIRCTIHRREKDSWTETCHRHASEGF